MFSEHPSAGWRDRLDALSLLIAARIPSWSISGARPGPSLRRRPAHEALHQPYLQFNHAAMTNLIIADCDHTELDLWRQNRLPPPNYIVYNKATLRHHLGWILDRPVYHGVKAPTDRPKRLLAHVRRLLTAGAKGDPFYTNQIGRNPIAPGADCQVHIPRLEPYGLSELFDLINDNVADDIIASAKEFTPARYANDPTGSRNCLLFHATRRLAYQIRPDHHDQKTFECAVAALAMAGNSFPDPLPLSEVKSIARSIAKWTWRKISPNYRQSRFKPDQTTQPGTQFSFATRPDNYFDLPVPRRRAVMTTRCWKSRFDAAVIRLFPLLRQPYIPQGRRIANRFCAFTLHELAARIGLSRAAAHPKITTARQWLATHGDNAEAAYLHANPDLTLRAELQPRHNPRKPYPRRASRRLPPSAVNQSPKTVFSDVIVSGHPSWKTRQVTSWQPSSPVPTPSDPNAWFNSGRFNGEWQDYQRVLAWQALQPDDYWASIGWDSRPPWEKGYIDENGVWRIARSTIEDAA